MESVRKRLAEVIQNRGLTYKEVSLAIGRNHSYIQQFIERKIPRTLKESDRMKLAKELGISEAELGGIVKIHEPPALKRGIINLDIRAGMGGGGALSVSPENGGIEEMSDGTWTMPDRVQAMFRNIGKTYAMPVYGDSMEPTLRGGSFVFVDTTITHPRDSDLYACDMGDGLVIKRLELIPKSENIWVKSDNESYRDYELRREDVNVYGRVIAHFQWRG